MVTFEEYTDPILYEEGFFENKESEQSFLNLLLAQVKSASINKMPDSRTSQEPVYRIVVNGYSFKIKGRGRKSNRTERQAK